MARLLLPRALAANVRSAVMLIVLADVMVSAALADAHSVPLHLKPSEPHTITLSLGRNQISVIHLHLQGGIVGVKETGPNGTGRPLWVIDLGKGAELTYGVGGAEEGDYTVEITSFEHERLAELSFEIDAASTLNAAAADLQNAQDMLANAELIRRHLPTAPKNIDAVQLYKRALGLAEKLNNIPLQRLILTQTARYLIFRQSDFAQANALLERAVALPKADDTAQQALAWKTLSTARYDLDRYALAIEAGLASLDLYRLTNDLYWQGIVLGNLSSVYGEMGQDADALAAAQEALKDAQEEEDTAGVVYCLSQIADLYQQQGNLEDALRTFQQGLVWVSGIGYAPLVEAEIQKDLGGFYVQIGEWEQASRPLQRCIVLEKGQNDPVSLEARGLLATVMQHQGKLQAALDEDTAAIAMARSLALKKEEANLLLKRSPIELALHRQAGAISDVDRAKAIGIEIHSMPLQIEATNAIGDALLETRPEEADSSYRTALGLAQKSGELEQQSIALAGLARTLTHEGRWEAAADSIESALKVVEEARGNLSDRQMQVTYFAMHRRWYELAVDICMELDRKYPTKEYAALAFAYTERARARSLLDALNLSGYTAELTSPASLRERYARNRHEIELQQALLDSADELSGRSATERLKSLHLEDEGIELQMRSADARLSSPFVSRIANVAEIQQLLLESHSVLLSYWVGENRSYRWLIAPNSVSVEELPRRDQLERAVLPLERMLQERRPSPGRDEEIAGYVSREREFATRLKASLGRAGSLLLSRIPRDANMLLVVADGCLRPLPFGALRIQDGSETSYALRRYAFLIEPSASTALYLEQHAVTGQAPHIAVFADPVFSLSDPRLGEKARAGNEHSHLLLADMPRLAGSIKEAQSIARYASSDAVSLEMGFDAAPERVRALPAKQAAILHFATHTVTLSGHPEATGIALSAWTREGKRQDGVFWLKDIYALHLPSGLVVLSGCDTNRQRGGSDGEGLNNLVYAFFFAGAHSVVGSLWAVDDDATSHMMDSFYRELLQEHQSASTALRSAQLKMLANPQTASPSAWASFVAEGWPVSYPPQRGNPKNTVSDAGYSTGSK